MKIIETRTLDSLTKFLARRGRVVKLIAKSLVALSLFLLQKITRFTTTPETSIGNVHMLLGIWEAGTTELVKKILKPGMVAVDVGAHVGYFTHLFARRVGSGGVVYAFEPHPANFKLLEKNTRAFPQVIRVPAAVGSADGQVTFYESAVGSGSHSLIFERYSHSREFTVDQRSIDSFFSREDYAHPDLMKIDVESAEFEVLDGAKRLLARSDAPALILEFGPSMIEARKRIPRELLDRLSGMGYTLYAIDEYTKALRPLESWGSTEQFVKSIAKYMNIFATKTGFVP